MYLRESFEAIPDKQEINPTMSDVDAHLWRKEL